MKHILFVLVFSLTACSDSLFNSKNDKSGDENLGINGGENLAGEDSDTDLTDSEDKKDCPVNMEQELLLGDKKSLSEDDCDDEIDEKADENYDDGDDSDDDDIDNDD